MGGLFTHVVEQNPATKPKKQSNASFQEKDVHFNDSKRPAFSSRFIEDLPTGTQRIAHPLLTRLRSQFVDSLLEANATLFFVFLSKAAVESLLFGSCYAVSMKSSDVEL